MGTYFQFAEATSDLLLGCFHNFQSLPWSILRPEEANRMGCRPSMTQKLFPRALRKALQWSIEYGVAIHYLGNTAVHQTAVKGTKAGQVTLVSKQPCTWIWHPLKGVLTPCSDHVWVWFMQSGSHAIAGKNWQPCGKVASLNFFPSFNCESCRSSVRKKGPVLQI